MKNALKEYFMKQMYPYIDFATNYIDDEGNWNADGKKPYKVTDVQEVIKLANNGIDMILDTGKNSTISDTAFTVARFNAEPGFKVLVFKDTSITWA